MILKILNLANESIQLIIRDIFSKKHFIDLKKGETTNILIPKGIYELILMYEECRSGISMVKRKMFATESRCIIIHDKSEDQKNLIEEVASNIKKDEEEIFDVN